MSTRSLYYLSWVWVIALLGLRQYLVTETVNRKPDHVVRRPGIDLFAQLADKHVDRPVTSGLAPPPDPLQQLVACDNARALRGEGMEEAELGRREPRARISQVGLDADGVDSKLGELDRITTIRRLRANPSAS